jgi:hypothetical protein
LNSSQNRRIGNADFYGLITFAKVDSFFNGDAVFGAEGGAKVDGDGLRPTKGHRADQPMMNFCPEIGIFELRIHADEGLRHGLWILG